MNPGGAIAVLRRTYEAEPDPAPRRVKAERVLAVLRSRGHDPSSMDCLEVGTGPGLMSEVFARRFRRFVTVDLHDMRADPGAPYGFLRFDGRRLPCPDRSFDAVVCTQVDPYVEDKDLHLSELARVLRPGGVVYYSTTNRYAPVDPQFHLPLLGFLPRRWATTVLRLTGRAHRYDLHCRGYRGVLSDLARHFQVEPLTLELIRDHHRFPCEDLPAIRLAARLPGWLLALLQCTICPSWVFLLRARADRA